MNQTQHITTSNTHRQTWVSREFKERFAQVAKVQGLSQSTLLRRLLEKIVLADQSPDDVLITQVQDLPSTRRVSVRLRADDLLFLRERARARGFTHEHLHILFGPIAPASSGAVAEFGARGPEKVGGRDRLVHNLIFSMPPGTPPKKVYAEGEKLLLTGDAEFEAPPARTGRVDQDEWATAVAHFVGLFAGLGTAN